MNFKIPHEWLYPDSLSHAVSIQKELAARVIMEDDFSEIDCLGGMDVSNNPFDPNKFIHASVITLQPQTLALQEQVGVTIRQDFPYITGFLGFREAPALVEAFRQLKKPPSIIFVDGHGISHPRGLGIASHIGVLLDCPTIGVAKTLLIGKPIAELGPEPGDRVPIQWKDKTLGILLCTKRRARPLIISTGHRVKLETAVELVQECLRGYRLPEPTRQAHLAANLQRKKSNPIFNSATGIEPA